uniref:Uncharacterized protein n=2 Tax=Pseudomonas TaxID=286 RepID=A0A6B7Q542_PSEPU|nr:hypothetical protein [Pseudomonas putida]
MAPALTHAQSKCDFYKIDESSSLELWAFRSQWQVAKVRAGADQHWSFAESLDHVTRVMVSHHPVWSSKHGKISPPDTWPGFTATFQKIISVDACRSRDELNGLVSASLCIFGQGPEAMSLAITNGAIRDLTITRVGANNHSPGCELFKVTGAIEVAMSPYQTESGLDHLEDTIRSSVGIKLSLVDGATATGQLDAAQRSTIWVVERR